LRGLSLSCVNYHEHGGGEDDEEGGGGEDRQREAPLRLQPPSRQRCLRLGPTAVARGSPHQPPPRGRRRMGTAGGLGTGPAGVPSDCISAHWAVSPLSRCQQWWAGEPRVRGLWPEGRQSAGRWCGRALRSGPILAVGLAGGLRLGPTAPLARADGLLLQPRRRHEALPLGWDMRGASGLWVEG
jgi:hypothetical protein